MYGGLMVAIVQKLSMYNECLQTYNPYCQAKVNLKDEGPLPQQDLKTIAYQFCAKMLSTLDKHFIDGVFFF